MWQQSKSALNVVFVGMGKDHMFDALNMHPLQFGQKYPIGPSVDDRARSSVSKNRAVAVSDIKDHNFDRVVCAPSRRVRRKISSLHSRILRLPSTDHRLG